MGVAEASVMNGLQLMAEASNWIQTGKAPTHSEPAHYTRLLKPSTILPVMHIVGGIFVSRNGTGVGGSY